MRQEEQETIKHRKSRGSGGGVSVLSHGEPGSFKWIRSGRKNRRTHTIDDSGRFVTRVLTHFPAKLFMGNKKVKPQLLLRLFPKLHAFILPEMRLNRLRLKSGRGWGGGDFLKQGSFSQQI